MSFWTDIKNELQVEYDVLTGNATGAAKQQAATTTNEITSWASSQSGGIASGLSVGIENVLQDIFDVVLGALEIIAAVILLLIAFSFAFKNGLLRIAPLAAAAM